MKTFLKWFGIASGSLLLILYLAFLFVLPNALDLNQFKPDIQKVAKDYAQLDVNFENAKILTTPLLAVGLKADDLSVKLPDGSLLVGANGFKTRNGDCRPANSINTAMQLTAVIFQIQSQDQFGGVGSMHFDYDIAPYVKKSFKKHLKKSLNRSILTDDVKDKILEMEELLRPCSNFKNEIQERIPELNETINSLVFTNAWNYAIDDLEEEGKQSAQALYHNLNTLESRPGSQVPFTSINFGTDTSCEGRLVSKWILNASVDGIGKFHRTSIFPISIFQYKKGINDKKGTPNYDLYEKVLESISKRIYPNIVNCNWSQNIEDESDIDTMMSTMGK